MRKKMLIVALLAVCLGNFSFAHGQKQTERFIPLGQSPGLSGKYTYIGVIESTDAASRSVTITVTDRKYRATVTDRTRIWLDRSRQKQTTLTGGYTDLRPGRRIEIKYEDLAVRQNAEWIKVEAGESDRPTETGRTP